MKKFFLFIFVFLTIILPVKADEIAINSHNAIVINLNDDKVLYTKNPDEQIYIASLTKMMTALVAIENIQDLKATVTITPEMLNDIYEYSKAGFKEGDVVTYEDLLYAVLLPSGADAVQALAITLTGSNDNFAALMNKKAEELGLKNTHFSNGIGKDENNYSTVRDVSLILKTALKNELFYKIFTTKTYTTSNGIDLITTVSTHNLDTSLIKGSKTGFTDAAGLCIAALYEDEEYRYIAVTANANYTDGKPYHIMDANTIFQYYLDHYHYVTILKKDEILKKIPIQNSNLKTYELKPSNTLTLYLPMNIQKEDLNIEVNTLDTITESNDKGTFLGNIRVTYENQEYYYSNVYLDKKIKYKKVNDKVLIIFLLIMLVLSFIYNVLLRRKIHRILQKIKGKNKK